ncbi:MAG: DNA-binding response regulator [Sulfurospirillum sp.]|nr:MAG: DNA-binding response regulator [Sulfurospirillum sp.]
MKILLLEDDPILSDLMYDYLIEAGYDVTLCMDGNETIEAIDSDTFDLFIFDINVPGKSGLDVLKDARDFQKNTPAIFITAYQDIDHLKQGFTAGCDDYIKKPFELEELEERINNLKKRYHIEETDLIRIDDIRSFDFMKRRLLFKNGTDHALSLKEAKILHYLLNHPERVISTDELMQNIWDYDEFPSDATLRVYIKNLRQALGKDMIRTVRGLGYSFEPK